MRRASASASSPSRGSRRRAITRTCCRSSGRGGTAAARGSRGGPRAGAPPRRGGGGAGEHDGVLWLSMRLVDGADLRTVVVRDGPLAPARAASVVAQLGAALDAAHLRRLVHRDVKPANVLLTSADHAYLTDFGLVK